MAAGELTDDRDQGCFHAPYRRVRTERERRPDVYEGLTRTPISPPVRLTPDAAKTTYVPARSTPLSLRRPPGVASPPIVSKERFMSEQPDQKSWLPTRKWIVGLLTSVVALVLSIVQSGHWTKEYTAAILTVVVGAITSYLIPNNDNPGGYPLKKPAIAVGDLAAPRA
jgi:hypothetical protein